jgi:serine/threonine protein kinase
MADPLTGTLLSGRYRLLEPIRSDEAGSAWAARDEMLGRRVGVKELSLPGDVSAAVRPGLLRQAAAMARNTGRLTHDGIITVYDVFEDHDRVWVITQLVAGRTLHDDVTAKGPWNPERVALLGVRLCEALEAAHISQMVHRDVRPGNVVIPDRGGAMLSDLATSTAVAVERLPADYVAPERRAGQRVTVATDLFGLGATLYFAAVGRPPAVPLAYPSGVVGKVVRGLMAADPATRMPLHRARDMLAGSVTTPEEILDDATLPAPAPRRRLRLPVALVGLLVLALAGAAFAYTKMTGTVTPTVSPSRPDTPVGATSQPDTTPPQPPAGLHVQGRTTTAITLAWEPATDDVGIAGYRILRDGQKVGESSAPGYTDSGLTAGAAYSYTVVSVDAAGNVSQPSAAASAVTLKVPDTKKPTTPSRVRVTGRSTTTIGVSWAPSADDVGVTAYQVFRDGTRIGTVSGTRLRDSGLSPTTTYQYQVRALDAAGNMSPLSARVRAVTLAMPDAKPPSAPTGSAVTASASAGTVDACPDPGISGSVTITTKNTSHTVTYSVTMWVDGADAGSTTVAVAPGSPGVAKIGPVGGFPAGTHSVAFTVSDGSTSKTANAGTVDVPACVTGQPPTSPSGTAPMAVLPES